MLGSFPPPKARWSMDFFYPNLQNDMWRIFGLIFFQEKNYFLTADGKRFDQPRLEAFLRKKSVALFDTASRVRRLQGNAADKFLEIEEPTDVKELLSQIPLCRAVVTTGQKASETLCQQFGVEPPAVGHHVTAELPDGRVIRLWRMPSSSRAYPLKLEKKAAVYAEMFRAESLFHAESAELEGFH
ncbi:MAG: uracil-DNA glycosylase family protein [Alloprevotella sp.]